MIRHHRLQSALLLFMAVTYVSFSKWPIVTSRHFRPYLCLNLNYVYQ
jgi:hypothetical protein